MVKNFALKTSFLLTMLVCIATAHAWSLQSIKEFCNNCITSSVTSWHNSSLATKAFVLGSSALAAGVGYLYYKNYQQKASTEEKRLSDLEEIYKPRKENPFKENPLECQEHSWMSWDQLQKNIQQFIAHEQNYITKQQWLQNNNPFKKYWLQYFNPFQKEDSVAFKPFVQKYILPAGSKIAFFGDLHGNIHGLIRILCYLKEQQFIDDHLRIIDPTFYIAFLGDYVDRGTYGAEVIYTLLQLKLKNPNHVFLVRGNHEDTDLNAKYGFSQELLKKFGQNNFDCIYRIYDYMPAALYLGIKNKETIEYIQCCHGGLELGYNPKEFLASSVSHHAITRVNRQTEYEYKKHTKIRKCITINENITAEEICDFIPTTPTSPHPLGLMWTDFDVDNRGTRSTLGRGICYGQDLTEALLENHSDEQHKIVAVFRAHQHNGTMLEKLKEAHGMVDLYDGLVYTFLSVPVAGTGFENDSIGILHINDSYKLSRLEHRVIPINTTI